MSFDNNFDLPSYSENFGPEISTNDEDYLHEGATNAKSSVAIDGTNADFNKGYSDILPSFEMHNFMFNRTLNEDIAPDYQESMTETMLSSTHQIDTLHSADPILNNASEFVLNNLDKLQKLNLPIEVKVNLTKNMPKAGTPCEKENSLRQYYPGDMIFGYVTFENKTKVSLPFEMLLVSLECDIGVINPKTRNQIKKKVIAMYDLEASYNSMTVDTSSNMRDLYDPVDNTLIAFKSRLLQPGQIVKRFFKFRIPTFLLDENCSDQFPEHLKIPPSFGLNATSMKYAASLIQIDPNLGYGRLSDSGSPIKVDDYALPGEFCSYFIHIQMIGKRLNVYKQFYTAQTTHLYDFIFLKNTEHHFRVGKPPHSNEYRLNYGSTKDQLTAIEKTAIEAIQVLTEREMLSKVDVTNFEQQNEIIFSSSGKLKVASTAQPDQYLEKRPLNKSYEYTKSFNFKKELFSKVNGELTISAKMEAGATIESFLPKLMENKPTSVLFNEDYMKSSSPVVTLELTFKSLDNSGKFPTSFTINPSMFAMDVQSVNNIPFIIDDDYLLQNQELTKSEFKKYALYSQKISDMMSIGNVGIPKATAALLKSMAYLRYTEIAIPHIFKSKTLEIARSEWKFDSETNEYKANVKLLLELDTKNILANPKALLPSFQTCKFARLYKIQLDVSPKRGKNFKSFFPITVI